MSFCKKSQHLIINLICCFVLNKKKRKELRYRLRFSCENRKNERLMKKQALKSMAKMGRYVPIETFKKHRIKNKSILILEFNDFHGITLPGYIHYFRQLGYNVDLFVRYGENVNWQPFVRVKDKYLAFVGDEDSLTKTLHSEKIKKYDFVFMNTTFYYGRLGNGRSVIDIIGKVPAGKYGTLMVEHNPEPYIPNFKEEKYIENGTLFTLLGFKNTKMLSSSYIGEIKHLSHQTKSIQFLSIGVVFSNNRNYHMLRTTVQQLLKEGINNFTINIIGRIVNDDAFQNMTEEEKEHIHLLGNMDYPEMFNYCEKADYFLTLFDSNNKEHLKYLDNWASGISILIYAFKKPALIEKYFASAYHLTDKNAIVYEKDFYQGVKEAILLSPEQYQEKCKNMNVLQEELQRKSLENLKQQIESMKG